METPQGTSPRITHISWGEMHVEGLGKGKDFKLWPGGGRPWDWSETGTNHVPGIQRADVAEVVAHGAGVVVLSQGMLKRLETAADTMAFLQEKGIAVHVAETKEAVEIYNQLCEKRIAVGGLFHSTC